MVGLNSIEMQAFFKLPSLLFGKSVQPAFRFSVTFLDNPFSINSLNRLEADGPGPMPIIRSYHVLSISIPTYNFEKELMMYGQVPRSFPVLNFKGFDISINMEEDELGTIAYFINWMQRSIIDKYGYYRAPIKNRFGMIVVEVQDKNGLPVVYYTFHDCYFMNATDITYDYGSSDSIKYQLVFGADRMSTWFTKYSAISAGLGSVLGVAKNIIGNKVGNVTNIIDKVF